MKRGMADYFRSNARMFRSISVRPGGPFVAGPAFRATIRRLSVFSLLGSLVLTVSGTSSTPAVSPGQLSRGVRPMFFEPGPPSSEVFTSFLARGPNYQLVLSAAEVNFVLRKPEGVVGTGSVRRDESLAPGTAPTRRVRMAFVGGNAQAQVFGADQLEGRVNYLIGNNPAQWRAQVPMFAKVKVDALYPGIDLVYYDGNHQHLEYDFTIAPKTDPSVVCLRFEGVDKLAVNSEGELVVGLGTAELRQHAPVAYQIARGARRNVPVRYQMKDRQTVCFALGTYDHDTPLVIDPVFSYATYFGGNGGDTGLSIKVDASGSVYIAGETLSTQFPWTVPGTPFQSTMRGGVSTGDAFVAKLDNTGTKLIYFTYLGGSGDDGAYDLAIDKAGNAYITGFTVSPDFPVMNALFSKIGGTADPTLHLFPTDAFIAELNTNGSALVYSTYLGGTDKDLGSSIAVDPSGYTYVTGYTFSTNFPVQNPLQSSLSGNDDVFVAKLAPGGRSLVYSTYLGGVGIDEGEGLAADGAGFAYVAGYTDSTNFPVTPNALGTNLNGSGISVSVFDGFVTKIAPDGQSLYYSTYLGGVGNDFVYRIALDGSGNAYVTGATQSTNFPHASPFELTLGQDGTNLINFDAFLTKLDASGALAYSVQFGGTANDAGWDVAVDPLGRAFVIGITVSTNFPVVSPFGLFRGTNSGNQDIFVVAFNTNATAVHYSGYLGGASDEFGYAIAVDSEANAYISGMTFSSGFPITPGAFQSVLDGTSDAFIAKIRLQNPALNVAIAGNFFEIGWPATAPGFVLQSTPGLIPPSVWTTLSQSPILTNGEYLVTFPATNTSELFRLQGH
jgi:hypothetical protein